jgi:hypothetical protein
MQSRRFKKEAVRIVGLFLLCGALSWSALSQTKSSAVDRAEQKRGSHTNKPRAEMSTEARALLEQAIDTVCTEQKLDPMASMPIDEMQARPSLPVHSPEAQSGFARAQRVLPIAKTLVISALQQLATEYGLQKSEAYQSRLRKAINRVRSVSRVRPDMDSRDNASVFLTRPHTITFGTIFLAGLRSDEGMISVLAHELMHIADGNSDSLRALVAAVSLRASSLTGLDIRDQRGEELTCDLVGAMAVRSFVSDSPSYESVARRLARAVEHNCVDVDEGDDDHLSPRNTVRALLAIHPVLVRELVSNKQN